MKAAEGGREERPDVSCVSGQPAPGTRVWPTLLNRAPDVSHRQRVQRRGSKSRRERLRAEEAAGPGAGARLCPGQQPTLGGAGGAAGGGRREEGGGARRGSGTLAARPRAATPAAPGGLGLSRELLLHTRHFCLHGSPGFYCAGGGSPSQRRYCSSVLTKEEPPALRTPPCRWPRGGGGGGPRGPRAHVE